MMEAATAWGTFVFLSEQGKTKFWSRFCTLVQPSGKILEEIGHHYDDDPRVVCAIASVCY